MTFHYSDNEHYKWGFNGKWFNKPQAKGYFQTSIGACRRPHGSFREECINSAKLIGERLSKPILVGLSGGFDSQVVCLSFMNAGVPFNPVILRLTNEEGKTYNDFDINGAFEFCKKFNLEPIVETLNVDRFFYETAPQLISDYCITVAEIAVQLHLVIKYKDTHAYVNGGGDPNISQRIDEDGKSELVYALGPTPIEQYMIDHDIEGCIKFFMYTPEQIAAFLDNDIMHYYNNAHATIHENTRGYDYFIFCVKPMMYMKEWPELVQRRKNTGFEMVPYFGKLREITLRLNDHINPRAKKITWTYEEMVAHLNSNNGKVKTWRSHDDSKD